MTIMTATIAPGLTVTTAQYEAAAAALTAHAPDVSLTWRDWTTPHRWGLVPDETTGRCYKAEFTLQDHPAGLLRRINLWFEPDVREKGRPRPHSHPWPFTAHVLTGGYSEDRYILDGGVHQEHAEHRPGGTNDLPRNLFHEVTELHEPGATLTLMVASAPGVWGGWGYLCPDTGRYDPSPPPSDAFTRAWRDLNPHRAEG
ncbi:hypothetical protein [Actinomadura opuntiae]|uniref:hypothetical protein n=1 Tax=Actinomadura sp. OS1-43 TaxID=604315 RepID=UPI00255B27BB|nr:hypothetical protein [Actinomadura sp. OS1-43]MDL4813176.1 hypothetical protein [Actinomadura sp. OS1-43]